MYCRAGLIICFVVLLTTLTTVTEGRNKKVVIHVPYKVKKIQHTHTVFRTVHHHHIDHSPPPPEEHEHFHHLHLHDESPVGQHSQPVAGIGIPEFLPDVPLNVPLKIPDVPAVELNGLPHRHTIPLYRRKI